MRGERPPEDFARVCCNHTPLAARGAELRAVVVCALARGEDDPARERVHWDGPDDARLGARGDDHVREVLVERRGLVRLGADLGQYLGEPRGEPRGERREFRVRFGKELVKVVEVL